MYITKGSVQKPDNTTYLVLPPTTEMCSTLRVFLVYASIFVLNGEKVTVVGEKQDI